MCSRYTPETKPEVGDIRPKFNADEIKPVIYPGYQTPTLLLTKDDDLSFESRFWSFVTRIPSKRNPGEWVEKLVQNAVSETVHEKRTFKKAWESSQRCILPAKNFMEPKNGIFVPIIDPENPYLAIAGIYGEVTYKGEHRDACTMLTTEPNSFMAEFHDRMPVIIHFKDVEEWLSLDTEPDQAFRLCRPYSGKLALA